MNTITIFFDIFIKSVQILHQQCNNLSIKLQENANNGDYNKLFLHSAVSKKILKTLLK